MSKKIIFLLSAVFALLLIFYLIWTKFPKQTNLEVKKGVNFPSATVNLPKDREYRHPSGIAFLIPEDSSVVEKIIPDDSYYFLLEVTDQASRSAVILSGRDTRFISLAQWEKAQSVDISSESTVSAKTKLGDLEALESTVSGGLMTLNALDSGVLFEVRTASDAGAISSLVFNKIRETFKFVAPSLSEPQPPSDSASSEGLNEDIILEESL